MMQEQKVPLFRLRSNDLRLSVMHSIAKEGQRNVYKFQREKKCFKKLQDSS